MAFCSLVLLQLERRGTGPFVVQGLLFARVRISLQRIKVPYYFICAGPLFGRQLANLIPITDR